MFPGQMSVGWAFTGRQGMDANGGVFKAWLVGRGLRHDGVLLTRTVQRRENSNAAFKRRLSTPGVQRLNWTKRDRVWHSMLSCVVWTTIQHNTLPRTAVSSVVDDFFDVTASADDAPILYHLRVWVRTITTNERQPWVRPIEQRLLFQNNCKVTWAVCRDTGHTTLFC